MKIIRNLLYALLILVICACSITENEEVITPGFLKVYVTYDTPPELEKSALISTARNFILYNGEYYTDVFQDPEQFIAKERDFVTFNIFGELNFITKFLYSDGTTKIDTITIPGADMTQVAYGSIPPGKYDKLVFQITPQSDLVINGRVFPVALSNDQLNVEIDDTISTTVKIIDEINIVSDKITSIHVKFDAKENVYRILDQFVFNTKIKSYTIENE